MSTPTSMQRFVMLHTLQGLPAAEIARLAGVSVAAIYHRHRRAKQRLSVEQRQRYLEALKRGCGRRLKVRTMSLSFANV